MLPVCRSLENIAVFLDIDYFTAVWVYIVGGNIGRYFIYSKNNVLYMYDDGTSERMSEDICDKYTLTTDSGFAGII